MIFEEIDRLFAKRCSQEDSLALCYLFAAARRGHHCVSIKGNTLEPLLPEALVLDKVAIIESFLQLPEGAVQEDLLPLNLKPVVHSGGHYYLQKYFLLENGIQKELKRVAKASKKLFFSEEAIIQAIKPYEPFLNADQKAAIFQCLFHNISLLTGGPGTGKTYTVRYLLQVYQDLCRQVERKASVLITAPTGKAAVSFQQKLQGLQVEISTLHRALKITKRKEFSRGQTLFQDLILVDESSMVDLSIWTQLLAAIESGSRAIFMGDPDQLPPVETGMIFQELFRAVPSISLKKCMRVESNNLLALAVSVKKGAVDKTYDLLKAGHKEIVFYEFEREETLLELPPWKLGTYFKKEFQKNVLLTPCLEGPWGVNTLNEQIEAFYRQEAIGHLVKKIPIMITQTDYRQELYNGDVGVLIEDGISNRAYFSSKEGQFLEEAVLPPYQKAYALSVHKSQGSEYEEVFLFLPEGSQFFGREILYTAITRAKHSLTIFAKKNIVEECLKISGKKHSALSERLSSFFLE